MDEGGLDVLGGEDEDGGLVEVGALDVGAREVGGGVDDDAL